MNEEVVKYYENYKEEDRLSTNHARRIEFITTIRIFDELFRGKKKILDCAAGTGAYAFYLADQGHDVTATDITPRHIEVIREQLKNKAYDMETAVLDATDMSRFEDASFDVVLNMGPFYHLTDDAARVNCLKESLRVLKKGGLLVTAYIPKFYVNQMIVMANDSFLDKRLLEQILQNGVLKHDDPKCFWTDTYYSSAEEMEALYEKHSVTVVDHFAQDGMSPMFGEKIDQWNEEQFQIWCEYHQSICRQKSILGMSNHVIIVGVK